MFVCLFCSLRNRNFEEVAAFLLVKGFCVTFIERREKRTKERLKEKKERKNGKMEGNKKEGEKVLDLNILSTVHCYLRTNNTRNESYIFKSDLSSVLKHKYNTGSPTTG